MPTKNDIIKDTECFVLDMDGTIYLGDRLFDFTKEFLSTVERCGKTYVFYTNNSSKNAEAYINKLSNMNISVTPDKMLISNQVIIQYMLKNYAGKSVYIVGTKYLIDDFKVAGITVLDSREADMAVLGFDTTLTYEKLCIACDIVRAGKPILGVNPDLNCPTDGGFIPDCGSMAALIEKSTGVMPEFFGKPSRHTLEYVKQRTGFKEESITFIGDRLYTDIAIADGTDAHSILVLTGESSEEDVKKGNYHPDAICDSLAEITSILREMYTL